MRRASPCGLALPPAVGKPGALSPYGGARKKRDRGDYGVGVTIGKTQPPPSTDSRRGRPTPAAAPATRRRPVRQSPVSRFFPRPGCLRTPIHANPKLALTGRHAGLALQVAVAVAVGPAVVAERVAAGQLVFARRRSWVCVLIARHGLRLVDGEWPGRSVDGELIEAHFGVAESLGGLVCGMRSQAILPSSGAAARGSRRGRSRRRSTARTPPRFFALV